MAAPVPTPVSGFVLAGGRSSRMGRDKALLELAGKPLVQHAVTKLRRLCGDVKILSAEPALAAYAPLVPDVHPGCGPMSGVEAALIHSGTDWNLILPVDVPFLPTSLLNCWLGATLKEPAGRTRVSMLSVDGVAHPALLILHKEMLPFLTYSLDRGHYRLLAALNYGAEKIAIREKVEMREVFYKPQLDDPCTPFVDETGEVWGAKNDLRNGTSGLWFANLNTPEEFVEGEKFSSALDT